MARDVPEYTYESGAPARHPYLVYIFAFNEGERLRRQLGRFPAPDKRSYDLMLGDDGSSDGSTGSELIQEFGLRGITRLDRNRGLSPVIKSGMDWYLKQNYKGVVLVNGNDRDSVENVGDFLEKFREGFDYVQGSRFLPGGEHVNTPGYRHWAIRMLHAPLFSLAAGRWMTDTTNGYRGFTTKALKGMGDGLFSERFQKYEVEQYMAWKTIRLGMKSCEIPVARKYPEDKSQPFSKIRPGVGWYHMLKPLVMLMLRSYD